MDERLRISQVCPVCASARVVMVAETGLLPVFCNQLCRTRTSAIGAPKANVKLGHCSDCGHVYNMTFDESLVQYGQEYENSLHFSAHFQNFADTLATALIERHRLRGKRVVEIGCGSGQFLTSLCSDGKTLGFGFDMSYPGTSESLPSNVTIRRSEFGAELPAIDPDFVCARHVLEHIAQPVSFLSAIRQSVRDGTPLYIEVPNALYTLRDGGIWDIIYEHCGYFTPDSLRTALRQSGFAVELIQEAFDGQFLCAHASASAEKGPLSRRVPNAELKQLVAEFVCAHGSKINAWRTNLSELSVRNQRIVAWGAGSKGSTFANLVARADTIPYVVDLNPRKHGMFVAGTGARIVPPEFLVQYRPDVVVVLNPSYRDEIRQRLESLGLHPTLLVA